MIAALVGVSHAAATAKASVTFAGKEYLHRWSKEGQHEFTPPGDEDLARWREMVTVNVHGKVADAEQLADVANRVLANYQSHGKILRTDSRPRTPQRPAEHLVVALLGNASMLEAAFARFVLVDGVGVVVVYSRRFYGPDAATAMGAWLQADGPSTERALMSWDGIPAPSTLNRLPEAK